jgi:hypothetical protein
MVTKIELLVDDLGDAQGAFDDAVPDLLAQARLLPAVQRIETGTVWPREDGSARPASRTFGMYFPGYDEASAATASPEGYRFFRAFYAAAGQQVTELFTDVAERG